MAHKPEDSVEELIDLNINDHENLGKEDLCKIEGKLRSALSVAKRNHTRVANSLIKILQSAEVNSQQKLYYENEFVQSETLLTKLETVYVEYLTFTMEEDDGDLDKNALLQQNVRMSYYTVMNQLSESSQHQDTSHDKIPIEQFTQATSHPVAPSTSNRPQISSGPKLKIPDMPMFDNSIRSYPCFKADFRNHYEKHYGSHAALVLKNNLLKGYSREICANFQTVDEIFSQLDSIYGDSGKLVETIMADVEKIKPCHDGNVVELRALRNVIQLAESDLKGVNLEKHIDQYQTVVMIVRKLPIIVQRRWAEKIAQNGIETDMRYRELMKFLDLEIRTMELMPTSHSQNPVHDTSSSGTTFYAAPAAKSKPTHRKENQSSKAASSSQPLKTTTTPSNDSTDPKCPLHPSFRGHYFSQCKVFINKSVEEKTRIMKEEAKNYCPCCLRPHKGKCEIEVFPCKRAGCGGHHFTFMHEVLHGAGTPTTTTLSSHRLDKSGEKHSVSPAQFVKVQTEDGTQELKMLWDNGSNLTLISKHICEEFGFDIIEENKTNLTIETAGSGSIVQEVYRCRVPLLNTSNEHVSTIVAYAIDEIGTLTSVNLNEALQILGIPLDDHATMRYPGGKIELLLGTDNAHLILRPVVEIDGLRLDESALGPVIYGRHSSFVSSPQSSAMTASVLRTAKLPTPPTHKIKRRDMEVDSALKSLFTTESMGVSCSPKCGRCGCGKCTFDDSGWSLQERYEYEQIRSSMTLENGVVTASYPYRKDISSLPDNLEYAKQRLYQLEKILKRNPRLADMFNEQFSDMIKRGKLRKLSKSEAEAWNGPVQYLPMNFVLKESSATTPLRIIFDPSTPYRGHAMNDYWGRGPNLVKDIFAILLRFCEFPVAFFADIRKMYQVVMLREREWHLHRVLYRYLKSHEPEVFMILCNSFGDGPAGTVATAALRFLAESMEHQYPRAAQTITTNTYVDDILDSEKTLNQANDVMNQVDTILLQGGFQVKKWSVVDSTNLKSDLPSVELTSDTESVLGVHYDLSSDEFFFKAHLNFSKKRRGAKTGPDLMRGEILDKQKVPVLTKRSIIAQTQTIYDPLGKLQPFVVEVKFALSKLYRYKHADSGRQLDWDDPVPLEFDKLFRELLNLFFDIEGLRFPRCLSSKDVVGNPTVIIFSDSSMMAFGACLYIRWKLSVGGYLTRLVSAKSRLWPIDPEDYLSVCRGELQGAVLAKRLASTFLKATRFPIEEILFIIDSEIVLAQLSMDSHKLSTFVGHRVAEILSEFSPSHWWFTRSESNPCADLLSRGTLDLSKLDVNSEWQTGPPWLSLDRESWPISQKINRKVAIPEIRLDEISKRTMLITANPDYVSSSERPTTSAKIYFIIEQLGEGHNDSAGAIDVVPTSFHFTEAQEMTIEKMFDLSRHDDVNFWLGVTYRVLNALSWRNSDSGFFERIANPRIISADQRRVARIFWIKQAQRLLERDIRAGRYKTLTPFKDDDGVYRCNARAQKTKSGYHPILLPHNHPFSRLIVIMFHRRGHNGSTGTAAKVRSEFHILCLRQLAMKVRNECQLCKLIEKRLMSAPMGSLPVNRLHASFPFEHSSCDIFGPFRVLLPGKWTRQRKNDPGFSKAYGLIITCLATRAVHILAMHSQNTEAFLLAIRRFIAVRGQPRSMYSDRGGQLVAADNELQSLIKDLDHDKIQQFGANNGIQWTYSTPGSPWQNGISEALIRSVKKTLKTIVLEKDIQLPILELETLFLEVAELLNERPINLGHQGASGHDYDAERNTFVCPNELLLGRCSSTFPSNPFQSRPMSFEERTAANQTLVTDFWRKWTELYLPSLVHQSKWYKLTRPPKIGDIVYVADLNPIRGQWTIAEIVEIPDTENSSPVNVLVRYKRPGNYKHSGPDKFQWRDVKNLCLIVDADTRSTLNIDAPEFSPS